MFSSVGKWLWEDLYERLLGDDGIRAEKWDTGSWWLADIGATFIGQRSPLLFLIHSMRLLLPLPKLICLFIHSFIQQICIVSQLYNRNCSRDTLGILQWIGETRSEPSWNMLESQWRQALSEQGNSLGEWVTRASKGDKSIGLAQLLTSPTVTWLITEIVSFIY